MRKHQKYEWMESLKYGLPYFYKFDWKKTNHLKKAQALRSTARRKGFKLSVTKGWGADEEAGLICERVS